MRAADPTGRGERGAVAVEAALLVPILIVLLLAVIEFALLMRDVLSVTEIARVGARTASAMPREADFADLTVAAMAVAGTALPKSQISEILIYKANATGHPGSGTGWSCAGTQATCDRYVWDSGTSTFVHSSGGSPWNPRVGAGNVNACSVDEGGPPDSVGIYVKATHPWATRIFGSTHTLDDYAVLPFEPLPVGVCK